MKKLTSMLIFTAMLCAALTACGQVEEPAAKEETAPAAETSAAAEESEAPAEEEPTPTPEEETPEVTTVTEAPESEPEVTTSSAKEAESSAPELSNNELNLSTIDGTSVVGESGMTFTELHDMGLANAFMQDGAYAVVPSDGGAGHKYYKVYTTADGGASWQEGQFYDEPSGVGTHVALDDGQIMSFITYGAYSERFPQVTYMYILGDRVEKVDVGTVLGDTELDDGRLLKDAGEVDFTVDYVSGYTFNIKFTDRETGDTLCDRQFDLSDALFRAQQSPAGYDDTAISDDPAM